MIRIFKLGALFALATLVGAAGLAQTTTTYTGTIKDLAQNPVTSGQVTFTLAPAVDSTVPGTGRFSPTAVACSINSDGTLSGYVAGVVSGACKITNNTSISPAGTSYRVCIQPYFATPGSCFYDYALGPTKDISTVAPTLSTGPLNYGGIPGPPGATGPPGGSLSYPGVTSDGSNGLAVLGAIGLGADPLTDLQAATKHYVDTHGGALCLSFGNQICITDAPYYASGQGATQTTTTATRAAGTSGAVASCATLLPNQGVYIAGAGAAGANYIGTIVSCSGTTLVVTPATSTSIGSGAVVKHDDTAAYQAAINTAATGGVNAAIGVKILTPDGDYNLNRARQDTGGANAVLVLPPIALGSAPSVPIEFDGFTVPVGYGYQGGAVLLTDETTGNLLNGYVSSGPYGGFISTNLIVNKMHFHSTQSDPGLVLLNAGHTATAVLSQTWFDSGAGGTPTNTAGEALIMPAGGNDVRHSLDQITIGGFYSGATLGEHDQVDSIWMANVHNCIIPDSRSTQGNAVQISYAWHQLCDNFIVGGTQKTTVNITLADSEVATTNFLSDPSNLLYGDIWEHNPYNDARSTSTIVTPHITGGANVRVHNLDTGACFGATCPSAGGGGGGAPPISLVGLVENWPGQDGSGTSFINTGSDYTNTLTGSNITWAAAGGFSSNVATYNGINSAATGSSGASTNFDAVPFSVCAWFNPTADQTAPLAGNLAAGPALSGWRLSQYSANPREIEVYIISDYGGGHFIHAAGVAAAVNVNAANQACFTADGTKTVAGVRLNVNGVAQTVSSDSDSISGGSIASTTPVTVGSSSGSADFSGAIGQVTVWSRVLSPLEMAALYRAGPKAF